MSDNMRWRYGDTNPVMAAVDTGTVIEIGDLVYLDTDDAKNAHEQADGSSEAQNQENFANNFLGVATQRSKSGETDPIRVATKGVFEFTCPSSTWEIGDLAGVDEESDGTSLEDQVVVKLGAFHRQDLAVRAIGKCAKRVASADTKVLIEITSTVMYGGVEAASFSGA